MNRFRIRGVRVRYDRDDPATLARKAAQVAGIQPDALIDLHIVRRSIDARRFPPMLVYTVDIDTEATCTQGAPPPPDPPALTVQPGSAPLSDRPVVVGAGPAGLFAAHLLATWGYRPVVFERGGTIEERIDALDAFWRRGRLNAECNALFGIGGAGTFSDGKLTTSVTHPATTHVLRTLVACGAPERILYDAKPHVGTDLLRDVVAQLVAQIQALGGEVFTNECVTDVEIRNGALTRLTTSARTVDCRAAIFAIGHSARDTWRMLRRRGVALAPKPFQMGVRVEHPQGWLDRVQYGRAAGHPALGAADYKVSARPGGTPVFSFCMCPGGMTIPAVNAPGHLCINGMSYHARDLPTASSGLVVTVPPEVTGATEAEDAIAFVEAVERTCFAVAGDYRAPAQRLVAFGRGERGEAVDASYPLGVVQADIGGLLPPFVTDALRQALPTFDRQIRGYAHPEAVVLAPESRASSPVRIVRDKASRQAQGAAGLYPVGEGAGYAGGIVSAAVDGLLSAQHLIARYAPL